MASKGRKKDSIRDISRQWPNSEEVLALLEYLDMEQPSIVVAILGVAMLEYDLERMLRPRFRLKDETTWARLSGDNGPVSTFYQKIVLAAAFGILDENRRKAFVAVKNIRNVFAHSKKLVDFDNPLIAEELAAVKIANKKHSKTYKNMVAAKGIGLAKTQEKKAAFIYLCLILTNHLQRKITSRVTAKQTRQKKKMGWLFGVNPLAEPFRQASAINLLGTPPGTHVDDPKSSEGSQSYFADLLRLVEKKPDNGDK
jgi:hypothetical protein